MRFKPIVKLDKELLQRKPVINIDVDFGNMTYDEITDYVLSDCGGFIP